MIEHSYHWQIGDIGIIRVPDNEVALDGAFLISELTHENLRRENGWLYPHCKTDDGRIRLSFHSLLLKSGGMNIVIDTCMGNDKPRPSPLWDAGLEWNNRRGPYLDEIARAGFPRKSIDLVVLTHLHGDHVGWNTMLEGGRWVPTFPKARYVIVREEWEFWAKWEDPHFRIPLEDSVRPVIDAGLVQWVDTSYRINDQMWLEATPGHTPAHVSVAIGSRGELALTTGDLIHHPIQCAHPDWNCRFDTNPEQAVMTRRKFLERSTDDQALVFGTHFAAPSVGRVTRDGGAFRFAVEH
ncbi:MAG: MBL fold metallo-hydrolase [Candidatus Binataceae bacterium]